MAQLGTVIYIAGSLSLAVGVSKIGLLCQLNGRLSQMTVNGKPIATTWQAIAIGLYLCSVIVGASPIDRLVNLMPQKIN